jgi:predicted porin
MNSPRQLTLVSLLALTPVAWAQSNVTISGIMDMAVRNVSNEGAGSLKSLVSGSNSTSRLAFTGREDLGNGWAAGFHLEHGILADTGSQAATTKFWDRRSTVSLFNNTSGEVRLGRDFVPSYTAWSRYDPFAYVGVARSANMVTATPTGPIRSAFGTNANTTVRSDNALQWFSPRFGGGFDVVVQLAAGEGGSATAGLAKVLALRAGYTAASWSLTAATTRSENSLTTAGRFEDSVLGGGVTVSGLQLSVAWREFKYSQSSQELLMVSAQTTSGPHEFKASWTKANMKGTVGATVVDANDATQLGLGYVYNLSKRSALYATVAQISNDGQARFVISDGPAGLAAGGTSRGYEFGIRHRF